MMSDSLGDRCSMSDKDAESVELSDDDCDANNGAVDAANAAVAEACTIPTE